MLEGLYAGALADAFERSQIKSARELESEIATAPRALNVQEFFSPREQVHILAEIKRASPSKGDLAQIIDAAELSSIYERAGASAISVLTEQRKFKGSLEDLLAVRARVSIPLLRKDFIANEYQVLEARAGGADMVLLIVAGLSQEQLKRLANLTEQLGMTAFLETHDRSEVERAIELGGKLIGVNARDLSTFETDRDLFGSLVELFPRDVIKVAESAVRNQEDVRHYHEAGADVVLVGEALVTSNAEATLQAFLTVK